MLLGVRAHFAAIQSTGHAACVRVIGGIRKLLDSLSGVLRDLLRCSRSASKEGASSGKSWLGVGSQVVKQMYRVVLQALPKANATDDACKGQKEESVHALAQIQAADSVLLRVETLLHQ